MNQWMLTSTHHGNLFFILPERNYYFMFIYLSIYRISKVVFLKKLFHSRFLLVFKYPSRTAKWFHCNLSIFFLNNIFQSVGCLINTVVWTIKMFYLILDLILFFLI